MFTWLSLEKGSPTAFSASICMWKITHSTTFRVIYVYTCKASYSTSSVLGSLVEIYQNSLIKLGVLTVSLSCAHQVTKKVSLVSILLLL